MATEVLKGRPSIAEILLGPNAQRRIREILDQHDLKTDEGKIAIHNVGYIAGIHGADHVFDAVAKDSQEHEIIKPAFEAGKDQVSIR